MHDAIHDGVIAIVVLHAPLLVLMLATCAAASESPEALAITVAGASCRSSRAPKNYAMVSRYSPIAVAIAASTPCFLFLPRSR